MAYSTINKSTEYFNTKLYSGNNTAQRQLTGVGFQPDLVWIKGRSGTYGAGYAHFWFDNVRGVGNQIHSNLTNAESTNLDNLYSFDSDGFSLGQSAVDSVTNGSSTEFVSWNWLASNTTASNTDGSITSTVSANTTAGFSIVSYSGNSTNGATIGHGLGTTPAMFIIKNRSAVDHWAVYHQSISPSNMLYLNLTNAQDPANQFNSTAATSSVFSVSSNVMVNASSNNYIAYCFAEVPGYSKFGSYTGNGNADGTFVYTGFKPSMVILKDYTSALNYNWIILDNKRDPSNGLDRRLQPSSSSAEYTDISDFCDFTSNGFKWRGSQANWNASGTGYIYMAFGQSLVGSNNVPCTAR